MDGPFAFTRLQVILLILICSSLLSIYDITFKKQALFTYNTKVNVIANLRTSNDTNGQIEDTDTHLNSQSIHEQTTKGTSDNDTTETAINWRKPSTPIRSWSCNLNETPLIFVHIGKAGGGTIRRRFAAGAKNYTRSPGQWREAHLDSHIYPLTTSNNSDVDSSSEDEESGHDFEPKGAKFCNSKFVHHRIEGTDDRLGAQYEGVQYCNATTPIGRMRACPEPLHSGCLGCDANSKYCHTVYTGHNLLGNEIHWLPPRILQSWWKSEWGAGTLSDPEEQHSKLFSDIEFGIDTLLPEDDRWCEILERGRPLSKRDTFKRNAHMWTMCSEPLALISDGQFHEFWSATTPRSSTEDDNMKLHNKNYSPIYASLPVHRVTVLREPFSWLLSKCFWHKEVRKGPCDDIPSASLLTDISNGKQEFGWAYEYLMT